MYSFPNFRASLIAQLVKKSACDVGDPSSISGSGRSPGEGKVYPLQYSGLENSRPWGLHSMGSQRVGRDWGTFTFTFPISNRSVLPCLTLNVASWPTCRFLRRQVRCSGIPICLRISKFVVIHTVKGFHIVNEAEVDVFLESPCYLYDPTNVDNLISGSPAFSRPSLYIWKLSVHILLKPSLIGFEHNFTSMWNEHNCHGS